MVNSSQHFLSYKYVSSFSLSEIEKDFLDLQFELEELQREIQYQRGHPSGNPDDLFLPTMEDFSTSTASTFSQLKDTITKMRTEARISLHFVTFSLSFLLRLSFPHLTYYLHCRDDEVMLKSLHGLTPTPHSLKRHWYFLERTQQKLQLMSSLESSPPSSSPCR